MDERETPAINMNFCISGMTPLHYAAWQGLMDPVRILLYWMAPVNEQAFNGDLPLHLACQHGHVDVVREICKHGVYVSFCVYCGQH